ncbi:MAG: cell division suppressor protein YneA [bacterium]
MRNVIIVCLLVLIGCVMLAYFNDKGIVYKNTIEISVEANDTLWQIASNINDGSYDNRMIVNQIRKMNNMDTAVLRPGQKLVVPLI